MLLFVGFLILTSVLGSGVSGHSHRSRRDSVGCNGDGNATYKECNSYCPSSCDDIGQEPQSCIDACAPAGCACNLGYVLNKVGKCINPKDCPEASCPKNEHYTRNNPRCIRTCANKGVPISDDCKPFTGCVCKYGLVRLKDDASGKCVPESKCPIKCKDCNAVYKDSMNPCPLTCAHPKPRPCPYAAINKGGCECAPNYVLNEANGRCVRPKDCPARKKCKDPNSEYVDCPNPCPLSCDRPFPRVCNKACVKRGRQCASGYILDIDDIKHGKCVKPEDCPAPICCPKHSRYVIDDNQCQKTCGNRLLTNSDVAGACVPFTGCSCRPGYVRLYDNATGPCIPESKCSPIPTECGANEEPTSCRIKCPPQTCDSIFTSYYCEPTECEPGCDCKNGYLRNKDGICILSEDCFKPDPIECGENEIASDCAIQCPPQSCESLYTTYLCAETNCTTGCNCIDGYLRNSLGICVSSEECYNDPAGCEGDVNATRSRGCSSPYPPTCENPDPKVRSDVCQLNGCECKPGYIKSSENENCIESKDCPGGSLNCGVNQTYVGCKFGCPTNYCPVDDSRGTVACSLPYLCQGGCACLAGYLIVSYDNPQCVLSSDCPEVKCTRPNEVFDRNPTSCFFESCEDRGSDCNYVYPPGPRCVCKDGYYRNGSDICVPVSECPPLGCKDDLNATYTECTSYCPPSCDDIGQEPKSCIAACGPAGCACNPGYVLNADGKCIDPADCPGCKDPNAVYKGCPSACEPTCAKPDRNQACTRQCMPPGCVCKPGFVLNEKTGKCVKPETCKVVDEGCGGDLNATHADCPSSCPPTCADRYSKEETMCIALCDPSGCVCKEGYILTKKGEKCVKSEDCPPVNSCEDPNAMYKDCVSACEPTCLNPNPQICTAQCLPPSCVCKPDFVMNDETGKCVKLESCPVIGCGGDPNAVHKDCVSACESTCTNPDPQICTLQCLPSGCVCKEGFVKNEETGECVKRETCPVLGLGCNGDGNATYSECNSYCPPSCDDIGQEPKLCIAACAPAGCACNPGYVLNKDGKCIDPKDCLVDSGCEGDQNATHSDCSSACPPICGYHYSEEEQVNCENVCDLSICECKQGYMLSEIRGLCVKPEDCPEPGCKGDPNAVFSDCPSACEPNCTNPKPQICTKQCMPPSCVCKPDFVLNEETGKCVKPETCPGIGCKGDPNAMYSECPSACEPTCTKSDPNQPCTYQCLSPGCVCMPGFVRNEETGKCVNPETCPAEPQCNGDRNATYVQSPEYCQPTCENPEPEGECMDMLAPPGCICKQGYIFKEKGGQCIRPEDCPGGSPTCKANETYVYCNAGCPTDYCPTDDSLAIIACDPPYPCPGGCACKGGYLMVSEDDETCILSSECPQLNCSRPNEFWDAYTPGCLRERCDDRNIPCDFQYPGPPRCRCIPGYYRNQDEICVPQCQGPKPGCNGDLNATFSECPSECPSTCGDPPDQGCTTVCAEPGCICNEGFVLSKPGGVCIRPEDCVKSCEDLNAMYKDCVSACEPTCLNPNPQVCTDQCLPPSCVCKPDFVLNEETGKCVKLESCPVVGCNGDGNATYSECTSHCPPSCNDIGQEPKACIASCAPAGCACNTGYVLDKYGKCIDPKDCPVKSCEDLNAMYKECVSACEPNCLNPNPQVCTEQCLPPSCVCKPDFVLNEESGKCVKLDSCPVVGCNGDGNATYSECTSYCPPSCDDIGQEPKACIDACAPAGCQCNPGYVLAKDGKCIDPKDCPGLSTPFCGINEVAKDCRRICPPQTCLSKYALFRCVADLPCEPGCDCVPNYLRNDKGICIPSEECPPLEPEPTCGYNEVSVPCRQICPPQNCELAYTDYACTEETKICEPGCDCLPDHLRNGSGICIPNDHCPYPSTPVCGINEIARDCKQICPPQSCQSKFIKYSCLQDIACEPGCDCVTNYLRNEKGICIPSQKCPPLEPEPTCGYNEISVPCRQICPPQNCDIAYTDYACTKESKICESGCDCLPDHLRNGSGICVPNDQCPGPCQIPDECQRTCASPNPLNCGYNPPEENIKGCDCKEGYILSEKGGDCIPIENCPPEVACHGDPNAAPKRCPKPCPSTCDSPDQTPCKRACDPIACECKPGHLLSNETGLCILPDKCPGGNPCGKNGRFVDCKIDCPDDYCPVDDSRAIVFCDPPAGHCLSGCICNFNNKRKSRKNPECITSSKCSPVNCTRPNEEWSSCPSACLAENCEDVNDQPTTCNTLILNCQPRCVCKKNHFRNSDGICIPAKDCPIGCDGDLNAVFKECPSACEPTCNTPQYEVCTDQCMDPGCVCKPGFVLNEVDGKCTELENCPVPECEDVNAEFNSCPSACEPTCASPGPFEECTEECSKPGRCVCKAGFVPNEKDGKCVKPEHCPAS